MHTSIKLECPVEFINVTPVNPLISKCQIKVCYVGDTPNRNRSIITKEVARQMANSLPGSPIVGYYNEHEEDFEEHNRTIEISNGQFEIKDTTRPYGFVDLNAKVWFAKYQDDDDEEREYLVTEGWLWTGQYPECRRILEGNGNNHSMELDEGTLNATWSKDSNGKPKFFIINEAIISKLCILGEDYEPCFEGSHITTPQIQFSFDDGFKEQLFSMMNELKVLLQEGGAKEVFTRYAVEIGDALWSALYNYIEFTYPDMKNCYCSIYRIEGIFEEAGQKFAVIQNRSDMKYYRLNFTLSDETGFVPSETLVEVTKSYTPAEEPQFALDAVEEYETEYAKKKAEEKKDKDDEDNQNNSDNSSEGEKSQKEGEEETCPECGKPVSECTCKKDKKKKEYSLEEIPEYVELQTQYSNLETQYNALVAEKEALEAKLEPLTEFKAKAEKKEKEAMIKKFYMLSDDDKKDVIENIDTYSLDDIEAKLSIICVRNKVSFDLDEDKSASATTPTTYNLESGEDEDVPAWVKRAISVAKTLK
jgi:hypothetical protein